MLKFRMTNSTKARKAAEAQRKVLEEKVTKFLTCQRSGLYTNE